MLLLRALILLTILATWALAEQVSDEEVRKQLGLATVSHVIDAARGGVRLANRAVIYRLGSAIETNDQQPFFSVEQGRVAITAEHEVSAADLNALRAAFLLVLDGDPMTSNLCHEPAHGIRFFMDKELILETSVCFHCNNYSLPFLSSSMLRGMGPPEASAALKTIITQNLP